MPDLVPKWFEDKRKMKKDALDMAKESFINNKIQSNYGNYGFMCVPFSFSDTHWFYSEFVIGSHTHDKVIHFTRDDSDFPYSWVKKHPKKRKYLLCSEDRQAISVIDLNSWKLHTWIDENDDFKVKSFFPNRSGTVVAILGSTFGELNTIRFYDLSDPIRFPWKHLSTIPGVLMDNDTKYYPSYIAGWEGDKCLRIVCESDIDEENCLLSEFTAYEDGEYFFDCSEVVEK